VVLPEVQRNLAFDVNEFVPIGFVAEQPYTLLASNKLGVHSVAELVALSKKQPGGLNWVAGTRGGLQHMTLEWFRKRSGASLNMIHYPGPAQAMNDVITGRVPVMMQTIAPVAGVVAAGEVNLLAIASAERLSNYPNTPTTECVVQIGKVDILVRSLAGQYDGSELVDVFFPPERTLAIAVD
jgi:tripartite-type tricarboxylate transporter receptor subunit TctC